MPGKGHAPARGHALESNTAMPMAMRRLNMAMRRGCVLCKDIASCGWRQPPSSCTSAESSIEHSLPVMFRGACGSISRHTAMRRYAATHEDGDVFQRLVSYRSLRTLELWAPRMETACDLDIHRKTRWGKHHIVVVSHHDHRSAGAFFNLMSLLPSALGAPLSASSAAASSVSRRVAYWVCHCGRTKAANFDDVLARPVWECADSGLDCLRH